MSRQGRKAWRGNVWWQCVLQCIIVHDPCVQVFFGGWPEVQEEGPRRYGPEAAGWVQVHEGWTLRDVLARPDHTMPGVPAFFVLAKGSDFRRQFLEGDVPLL